MKTKTRQLNRLLRNLWTVKQVAKHYQVTHITVHNWKNNGCPTVKIPGEMRNAVRFVPEDVHVWRTGAAA